MRTTAQLRTIWGPECQRSRLVKVDLHSGAHLWVIDEAAEAFRALDAVMQAHAYAPRPRDTGAYNCRAITGGTAFSLHAYGIAADYNWNTNPYRKDNVLVTDMPPAMVQAIRDIRTASGDRVFGWGGDYQSIKDAMHFEVVASRTELASGIDAATVAQPAQAADQPTTWPVLSQGVVHPAVAELRRSLAAAGFVVEGSTSEFDASTFAQVCAFQKSRGLTVDGIVGPQTWTALLTAQPAVAPGESPIKRVDPPPLPAGAASTTSLSTFYAACGVRLPSRAVRGEIYQAVGLGPAVSYTGSRAQNRDLLAELKDRGLCPAAASEV